MAQKEIVVEAISTKYPPKVAILAEGVWYGPDNKVSVDLFSTVEKGDKLLITHNLKWVSEFETLEKGVPVQNSAPAKFGGGKGYSKKDDADTQSRIARSTAVKSTFGSSLASELVKAEGYDKALHALKELTLHLEDYISSGKFPQGE